MIIFGVSPCPFSFLRTIPLRFSNIFQLIDQNKRLKHQSHITENLGDISFLAESMFDRLIKATIETVIKIYKI